MKKHMRSLSRCTGTNFPSECLAARLKYALPHRQIPVDAMRPLSTSQVDMSPCCAPTRANLQFLLCFVRAIGTAAVYTFILPRGMNMYDCSSICSDECCCGEDAGIACVALQMSQCPKQDHSSRAFMSAIREQVQHVRGT